MKRGKKGVSRLPVRYHFKLSKIFSKNKIMNTKKYVSLAVGLAAVASLAGAVPVFADAGSGAGATTNQSATVRGNWMGNSKRGRTPMMKPAIFGTVSSVNGTVVTVSGVSGGRGFSQKNNSAGSTTTPAATTFTVDASNAKVMKNNATSTVSQIAVGDKILVQGTVSGINVVATMIRDGEMMGEGKGRPTGQVQPNLPVQGNGQPVVAGTVSAISGSALTISNKSNVQYTVDVSNAKFTQGQNTISLSGVSVGDSVMVQGAVNGSSVVASSVVLGAKSAAANGATSSGAGQSRGFFGQIGQFFMKMFGF